MVEQVEMMANRPVAEHLFSRSPTPTLQRPTTNSPYPWPGPTSPLASLNHNSISSLQPLPCVHVTINSRLPSPQCSQRHAVGIDRIISVNPPAAAKRHPLITLNLFLPQPVRVNSAENPTCTYGRPNSVIDWTNLGIKLRLSGIMSMAWPPQSRGNACPNIPSEPRKSPMPPTVGT